MSLREQIVKDLTSAMKAQDANRTSTLRTVNATMLIRQIEKGSELGDDEMRHTDRQPPGFQPVADCKADDEHAKRRHEGGRKEIAVAGMRHDAVDLAVGF